MQSIRIQEHRFSLVHPGCVQMGWRQRSRPGKLMRPDFSWNPRRSRGIVLLAKSTGTTSLA